MRLGLGEFDPGSLAHRVGQGPLACRRRVQVDQRGPLAVVPHPDHEFFEVRARVGGELVPGVLQVMKVNALGRPRTSGKPRNACA